MKEARNGSSKDLIKKETFYRMAEKWEEQIFWKESENEWENIKTYELLNRYIRIIWKKAYLKRTGNRVRQDISQRKAEYKGNQRKDFRRKYFYRMEGQ